MPSSYNNIVIQIMFFFLPYLNQALPLTKYAKVPTHDTFALLPFVVPNSKIGQKLVMANLKLS